MRDGSVLDRERRRPKSLGSNVTSTCDPTAISCSLPAVAALRRVTGSSSQRRSLASALGTERVRRARHAEMLGHRNAEEMVALSQFAASVGVVRSNECTGDEFWFGNLLTLPELLQSEIYRGSVLRGLIPIVMLDDLPTDRDLGQLQIAS